MVINIVLFAMGLLYRYNKTPFCILSFIIVLSLQTGCVRQNYSDILPQEISLQHDSIKMRYLMEILTPDSLAHWLCFNALNDTNKTISSFNDCVRLVYCSYDKNERSRFAIALEDCHYRLPRRMKLKLEILSGSENPYKLGLIMGSEYKTLLDSGKVSEEYIHNELKIIERLCGADTVLFLRIMKGININLHYN